MEALLDLLAGAEDARLETQRAPGPPLAFHAYARAYAGYDALHAATARIAELLRAPLPPPPARRKARPPLLPRAHACGLVCLDHVVAFLLAETLAPSFSLSLSLSLSLPLSLSHSHPAHILRHNVVGSGGGPGEGEG
jgi:hypothetical protein